MDMPGKVSFMLEISRKCNQRCSFCYNTWKADGEPVRRPLSTRQLQNLLSKVVGESDCYSISVSGGEPLLRNDVFDIISFAKKKGVKVCLLSNGTLLTKDSIDRFLSIGVDVFQVTLLGDKAQLHNRLAGADAFDRVLEAVLNINDRGGTVHANFVALAENVERFGNVLELCVLLRVNNVSFDRFVPGGAGLDRWQSLLPAPGAVDDALAAGDEVVRKYGTSVSVSTPILPCLNDTSQYKHINLSYCAVARKEHALFCIDPEGNLKVCSHSPHVLGNLLEKPFSTMLKDPFLEEFEKTLPPFCRDCPVANDCRGGCRSSAQVCYGSFASEEPYLRLWKSKARRPITTVSREAAATGRPELEAERR